MTHTPDLGSSEQNQFRDTAWAELDNAPMGAPRTFVLGVQQVLVSNVWLDPVFIASAAGLSAALSVNLISGVFLAAGIVTLIQSTRLVKLPVVEGPSATFDPFLIGYGKSGQLAAAVGGILVGAAVIFLATAIGLFGRVRRLFSPAVTGAVILLVGLALANYTLIEYFGGNTESPHFASASTLAIATITMLTVIVASSFGKGSVRAFSFLWALIIGDALAGVMGRLDISAVESMGWVGVPDFLPYGTPEFTGGIIAAMTLAFLVATIEAVGVYAAAAEVARIDLTPKKINRGIGGEAIGSAVGTLFGGFTTTAFGQNVGLMKLTGVTSRRPVQVAACLFIAFAFIPKLGGLLVATPAPVVGGLFLPAAASLVFIGVQRMAKGLDTPRTLTVGGVSVMAGMGVPALGDSLMTKLPQWAGQLVTQPIVVGAVIALVAELLLVQIPKLIGRGMEMDDG